MTWQDEMQAAAREVIRAKAVPVVEHPSTYGWKDYAAGWHMREDSVYRFSCSLPSGPCELVLDGPVRELEWSEFQSTYDENSQHVGIESSGRCACGAWSGVVRYEGTLGDVVNRLLEETVKGEA